VKLLSIRTEEGLHLGIKTERGVIDIPKTLSAFPEDQIPKTVEELVNEGTIEKVAAYVARIEELGVEYQQEEHLTFGPCVPAPGKIICVGLNYRKHAEESNMSIPESPILFNKFNNAISAHGDIILLPSNSSQVDYEAELTIVMGKRAKKVSKENALSYVFGYCNGNDLSARDLQMKTSQWLLGKSCDGFSPLGPYLVTSDEVGDPNNLQIKTFVNGEIRQDSNTSDMIFHCDEIVSYISQHLTLEPGDIILTGTPEGVVLGYPKDSQIWLKDGDEVVIEIEKLGRLVNYMKQEECLNASV
jgi:2-keto-4-pentenoate hydratase/2-oxohepta-3-ene-1,7-dioic acid hydratase in catechol pathway